MHPPSNPRATLESISPFFVVADARRASAFYCDKLGFEVVLAKPDDDPFFLIVARDNVRIYLKDVDGSAGSPNVARHRWAPWDAFVFVEDPDALSAEFSSRSVEFRVPLGDTHDGLHGFQVQDEDGYVLFFGRPRYGPSVG